MVMMGNLNMNDYQPVAKPQNVIPSRHSVTVTKKMSVYVYSYVEEIWKCLS